MAAALRAGIPSVICSMVADQPFHGKALASKGLGAYAGALTTVRAPTLAKHIQATLNNSEIKQRACAIGEVIRAENGLKAAASFIGRQAVTFKYPWALTLDQAMASDPDKLSDVGIELSW